MTKKSLTYQDAGVDVTAGNEAVRQIKDVVKKTFRPEVRSDLGGFGGAFALNVAKYQKPILVSGTDGVGTKLKIAFALDKHDSVGIDLVAMCVNDILAQGAEPLFFLDYIATGKLKPDQVKTLVSGIADGCKQAGCALIGGETAEMPGFYQAGEYDMAGFTVGVVEETALLPNQNIGRGHILIGLQSSGIHSNGLSLARKVAFDVAKQQPNDYIEMLNQTVGEALLTPTRIYVKDVLPLLSQYRIDGLAHITGGGFTENIPRMLPEGYQAEICMGSWPVLPIFKWLQAEGQIETEEMLRTFNMGIGMVLAVHPDDANSVLAAFNVQETQAFFLGQVTEGSGGVVYVK